MVVPGATGRATWATASVYRSKDRSDGNVRRPVAADGTSGRPGSQIVISRLNCVSACWIAGSAAARLISRPLTGNFADLRTWRGTRTTKWASRDSILTNAFIRLSIVNSCAFAGGGITTGPRATAT